MNHDMKFTNTEISPILGFSRKIFYFLTISPGLAGMGSRGRLFGLVMSWTILKSRLLTEVWKSAESG
jgi:hypothetical protein